jgi:hypothetical protein
MTDCGSDSAAARLVIQVAHGLRALVLQRERRLRLRLHRLRGAWTRQGMGARRRAQRAPAQHAHRHGAAQAVHDARDGGVAHQRAVLRAAGGRRSTQVAAVSVITHRRAIRCTGEVDRGPRYAIRHAVRSGARDTAAKGTAKSAILYRFAPRRHRGGAMMKVPCKYPEKGPMLYEARARCMRRAAARRRSAKPPGLAGGRNARSAATPRPAPSGAAEAR